MAVVGVAVVALAAATARADNAGFLRINVDFPNLPIGAKPIWSWEPDGQNASLQLTELLGRALLGPDGSFRANVSGETDVDPVLTITKDVTNDTGTPWIGYDVTLAPTDLATFVAGEATSDTLTLSSESDHALSYGLPSPVANDQTVRFVFDVLVPSGGTFGFTLTQTPVPIPEPATVSFMALGGLAILRRRRA